MVDKLNNTVSKFSFFPIIPFIFLILIGLVEGEITYHQKVFKTLLIIIFDFAMVVILFVQNYGTKGVFKKNRSFLVFFIVYFIHILIIFITSFITGEVTYDREYYLANYTLLILFAMFFYLYITDIDDLQNGLLVVSFFFLVVFIWSVVEFSTLMQESIKKSGVFNPATALKSFRPKFSFGNTDYFSGYAIGLIPIVVLNGISLLLNKLSSRRYLGIGSILLGLLGIVPVYFSQTRSAFLGLFLSFMAIIIPSLILIYPKIKMRFRIILSVSFILMMLILPYCLLKYPPSLVTKVVPRLVRTVSAPKFAVNDRLNGWAGGLGLFKKHPIFGAGMGTIYPASFQYIDKYFHIYSPSNSFKHSHNEFVEILGEGGLVGLLLFISLVGYILFSLYMKFLSVKYLFSYRLVSLGVCSGLVAMLVHQIFSLSLRMSVTQSAFFALLGIGVVMLSISDNSLFVKKDTNDDGKSTAIVDKTTTSIGNIKNYLNKINRPINEKGLLVLISIIFLFIILSFFLFLPLFLSESSLRVAVSGRVKSLNELNYFIDRAISKKKDNPYAWSQKFLVDLKYNLYKNNKIDENYIPVIINTLDTLNKLIPDYQDVWSKYAQIYLIAKDFYYKKWLSSGNDRFFSLYSEYNVKLIESVEKSININFLNLEMHILRINNHLKTDNINLLNSYVKEYLSAYIYLKFCKTKMILRENTSIMFFENNESPENVKYDNNIYQFNFSLGAVEKYVTDMKNLSSYSELKSYISYDIDKNIDKLISQAITQK